MITKITLSILLIIAVWQWIRWFFKAMKWAKKTVQLVNPSAKTNGATRNNIRLQFTKEFGPWAKALSKQKRNK